MTTYRIARLDTALVALLTLGIASCASARNAPSAFDCRGCSDEASITVDNGHTQDMRVSVVRNGTRIPLGRVGSSSRRTFALPRMAMVPNGSVRFVAEPIPTGPVHRSTDVLLDEGLDVLFTLAASPRLSSIRVR